MENTVLMDPQSRTPALEIRDLVASYGKRRVLFGVDLEVQQGEIVAVLGHNGAGKSTLLRSILNTLSDRTGDIRFFGQDIGRRHYSVNVASGISMVPAEKPVFRPLDVETNLLLGAYARDADRSRNLESVFESFPKLKQRRKQLAGTLSGGEQRMLAVGMALMNSPKLMLLDEPSIGLAPATAEEILGLVANICRDQGVSVVLVDQNVRSSLRIASRVYYIRMGKIILTETAAEAKMREHYWELF